MRIIDGDDRSSTAARFPNFKNYDETNLDDRAPSNKWISTAHFDVLTVQYTAGGADTGFFLDVSDLDSAAYVLFSASSVASVTAASGTPLVITANGHNLSDGDMCFITAIETSRFLNDTVWTVDQATTNTFQIKNSAGTTINASDLDNAFSGTGNLYKVFSNGTLNDFAAFELSSNPGAVTCRVTLNNTTDIKSTTPNAIATWASTGSDTDGNFRSGGVNEALQDADGLYYVPIGSLVCLDSDYAVVSSVAHTSGSSDIVITTTASHGMSSGDYVTFIDTGITQLDGKVFYVNSTTSTTLNLYLNSSDNAYAYYTGTSVTGTNKYVARVYQVQAIDGDGDQNDTVTLSPDPATASATVLAIYKPVQSGICRAGDLIKLPNPNLGMHENRMDYSVSITASNGHIHTRKRNVARTYSGTMELTDAQYLSLMNFFDSQRGVPFPCLVLHGMSDSNRHAIFAQFQSAPSVRFSYKQADYKTVDFSLKQSR